MNKMVNKTPTSCPPGAYFLVLVVTLIHVDLYSQWLHKKIQLKDVRGNLPPPLSFIISFPQGYDPMEQYIIRDQILSS